MCFIQEARMKQTTIEKVGVIAEVFLYFRSVFLEEEKYNPAKSSIQRE